MGGPGRLVAWLAAVASLGGVAAEPSPERYDPSRLEAIAIERARAGHWGAARILIERAARLSPHDARIARHRDEIGARRAPEPVAAPAPAPAPAAPPKAIELAPEPPPPWAPPR